MALGLSEDAFWRSTPRQIVRTFRAHSLRQQRDHNDRAWLAWHVAFLTRVEPKKFPKLEKLLARAPVGRRKPQTAQQQQAIMTAMFTAMAAGKRR